MPETESLLIFLGATLALNVTPGPDMLYVIARSTAEGTRAGVVSAFGIAAGTLVHLAAVALGLAALLEAVPLAYEVVRYAGAAFLIYLGVRALLSREAPTAGPVVARDSLGRIFRQGVVTNVLNPKVALFFAAFPLPQREAGARQALRYIGEVIDAGYSVLIFPEGKRTDHGEIAKFRPGVGMMAARLGVPVVPVRLEGIDRVLHQTWKMAKPGPVRVIFGAPMQLSGDDYVDLTARVESAVRKLGE